MGSSSAGSSQSVLPCNLPAQTEVLLSHLQADKVKGFLQFFLQGKVGSSSVLPCNFSTEARWSASVLLSHLPAETRQRVFLSSSL